MTLGGASDTMRCQWLLLHIVAERAHCCSHTQSQAIVGDYYQLLYKGDSSCCCHHHRRANSLTSIEYSEPADVIIQALLQMSIQLPRSFTVL